MKQFRKPLRHLCIAAVLCSGSLPFLSSAQAFPSRSQYVAAHSAAMQQQANNPAAASRGAFDYMAMFGHFALYW